MTFLALLNILLFFKSFYFNISFWSFVYSVEKVYIYEINIDILTDGQFITFNF